MWSEVDRTVIPDVKGDLDRDIDLRSTRKKEQCDTA
jgi:hypothetical protein